MEFSDNALVLQLGTFREADVWVRLLSPSRGIFSAFAFGGSKSRRRFAGCLDVFNEISVRVTGSPRNPYLAMQEGVLLNGVSRIRHDWGRYGIAVNCARFLQSFGVEGDGAAESFLLMRQTLDLLEGEEPLPKLLPLFFRLRLAFEQGYAVRATECHGCGASFAGQRAWLVLREGRIVCSACSGAERGHRIPLGEESMALFEAVRSLPPSGWNGMAPSGAAMREFARAVDGFIQYHVGIAWDRGRFVRY